MEKQTESYITFVRATDEQVEAIRETGAEVLSVEEIREALGIVGVANSIRLTIEDTERA